MNLIIQSTLVTEEKEERLGFTNNFTVVQDGYVLYPMDSLIDIKRTEKAGVVGQIIVHEVQWKDQQTVVTFELKSIVSVN